MARQITDEEQAQLPVHNLAAEEAVVACLLHDGDLCIDECLGVTGGRSDYFYDQRTKHIFEAVLWVHAQGGVVETIGVSARLDALKTGVQLDYLKGLVKDCLPASGMAVWLKELQDNFLARNVADALARAVDAVEPTRIHQLLADLSQKLALLADSTCAGKNVNGKAMVLSYHDYLQERADRYQSGKSTGILSGWPSLDRFTDGFQYGEQAVIGARPSMGKTALGCGIVCRACLTDSVPTLVVTLEMEVNALLNRMFACHHTIPMKEIRRAQFTVGGFQKLGAFEGRLGKAPLYFVDGYSRPLTAPSVIAEIRKHVRQFGVKLVLVDYLQKIRGVGQFEKKTYEVADVSGALKSVAQETGVALVTLAQLSREPDKARGRQPRLSDLADSGQIERDADLVVLIDRKRSESVGKTKLIVAKQRDGEIGVAEVWFNGEFCRFQNDEPVETRSSQANQPYSDS